MNHVLFEIESNLEIWELIDMNFDFIFIHKFNPHEIIEWWKTDLKINLENELQDVEVRNMVFDIRTSLKKLQEILKLESNQLTIYQFDKPISNTLIIENLPQSNLESILKENGLKHRIDINFEVVQISSFDIQFIERIKEHKLFKLKITNWNNRFGDKPNA
ncbi:hypothetical protein [Flavobacterium silvaticum]|uniref:Uncharacterized protein n=1 Tax=Flavobacterium silvaticum TaxID=1852020 RepID=A0A972FS21_9FLAO|nr:hypothetical protein [Flavobacterium silvaticum]NMH26480.1 hypothetical protein [Flavobacterium silvaticum]